MKDSSVFLAPDPEQVAARGAIDGMQMWQAGRILLLPRFAPQGWRCPMKSSCHGSSKSCLATVHGTESQSGSALAHSICLSDQILATKADSIQVYYHSYLCRAAQLYLQVWRRRSSPESFLRLLKD